MATSNFYSKSGKYYAVLMNYERPILDENDEETGEMESVSPDEFEVKDFRDYIQQQFDDFAAGKPFMSFDKSDQYVIDGHLLGTLSMAKQYAGIWIEAHYKLVLRLGYYEGANLDYDKYYCIDNCIDTEVYNRKDSMHFDYMQQLDYSNGNYNKPTGFAIIQGKHAMKWLDKADDLLNEAVNSIYTKNSTPLKLVGRFSNGGTIFERLTDES